MIWDGNDLHVVIDHPNRGPEDDALFRSTVFESDVVNIVPHETTLADILVKAGLFESKNEVRRNWKRGLNLKEGFQEFKGLGKRRRNLFILKLPDDFHTYQETLRLALEVERA